MNNFLKSILLFSLCLFIVSCSKSDSSSEPLRDYTTQRDTDMENIEGFMKTHYMTVVNNPGGTDDQDVTYTLIPTGGTQVSIWNQTDYPIQTREVTVTQGGEDITYKIYYLKLREGSGTNSKSPCNVDRVYAAYRGEYVYRNTVTTGTVTETTYLSKQFEEAKNPLYFYLYGSLGTIRGWSEIFPQFKTGSYTSNPDGTLSFSDFGAGVMFIPSGLAYYSTSASSIPSYSPLVFSIKLCEIQRMDQDGDGIPSYQEDINGDGYVYTLAEGVSNPDNTDGVAALMADGVTYTNTDEVPDFLDVDDDADGVFTKYEIINPATQIAFPFDEIPTCGGNGNGKKRYLDPRCSN